MTQHTQPDYKELDPEFKRAWLAALRSGSYKQLRGGLGYSSDKHLCCIGVGADVKIPGVCDRIGTAFAVSVIELDQQAAKVLIHMNDSEEHSFHEIADWIEKHL